MSLSILSNVSFELRSDSGDGRNEVDDVVT